jgi:hypothetical protein
MVPEAGGDPFRQPDHQHEQADRREELGRDDRDEVAEEADPDECYQQEEDLVHVSTGGA